jgi:hypothetical protein
LYEEYNDYGLELLSDAYIVFDKIKDSYDETKSAFTTYYANHLRWHISHLNRYDGIVHIPVLQKSTTYHNYISLDTPFGNSEFTYADILEDTSPNNENYNDIISTIESIKFTKAERECVPYIISGDVHPRRLRTMMANTKQKIADRLVKLNLV